MDKTYSELAKIFDSVASSADVPFQLSPAEQSRCLELLQSVTQWNNAIDVNVAVEKEEEKSSISGPLDSIRQAKELLAQSRRSKSTLSPMKEVELEEPSLTLPSNDSGSPTKMYITREAKCILDTINSKEDKDKDEDEDEDQVVLENVSKIDHLPTYHFDIVDSSPMKCQPTTTATITIPHIESNLPKYTFIH